MKLFIKNMNSIACIIYVKNIFKILGINYTTIELGQIETTDNIDSKKLLRLDIFLKEAELERIENYEIIIVEQIKSIIFELIQNDKILKHTFSTFISETLDKKYTYLSNIFLKICGINIKRYMDKIKINRVKELIKFNKLNMSEISIKMHFSSSSHLSFLFKNITNMTPSQFKKNVLLI